MRGRKRIKKERSKKEEKKGSEKGRRDGNKIVKYWGLEERERGTEVKIAINADDEVERTARGGQYRIKFAV